MMCKPDPDLLAAQTKELETLPSRVEAPKTLAKETGC